MFSFKNTFINLSKGRWSLNTWDVIALCFALTIISILAWNAKQMAVPYHIGQSISISLDPSHLFNYALRTILRMFIALIISLLFTFVFATWAAKSRRAGNIIIPMIDILQSVPILGFLSVATVMFIGLFPNSLLGPECAAIFVIFTSQAWNMALGFYQTLRSVPHDLQEAASMFHLSAWQTFWRIEVPFSMPGLLWNMMMSMSAGWFFVVASEAVSISKQDILLPGIGSYIALAIRTANVHAIFYAIFAMFIVILLYDQLFFRPLIAWADKFKSEQVATEKEAHSWLIDLFHRTRLIRKLGQHLAVLIDALVNISFLRSKPKTVSQIIFARKSDQVIGLLWKISVVVALTFAALQLFNFITQNFSLGDIKEVFYLGLITSFRIFVLIILCSLLWVPVGVWIGLRPRMTQFIQPIAQFLAAFPVNLLYPLFVVVIIKYNLNVNIWLTPLMILGTQWYVLFNVIAGASLLPKELFQVADNFGINYWLRWKRLILPGIFPYYITGAITAVGGAWNASIASEVVSWGSQKLVASGLGAYVTESTDQGDFLKIALGIGTMCLFVLVFNRLIWRPLYVLAETRYQIN